MAEVLRRLKDSGFRRFTPTDNLLEIQTRQLAALIRRPGNEILEVAPQPTFVGTDLAAIARISIGRFSAVSPQVA
jgi:hypothetical protein